MKGKQEQHSCCCCCVCVCGDLFFLFKSYRSLYISLLILLLKLMEHLNCSSDIHFAKTIL